MAGRIEGDGVVSAAGISDGMYGKGGADRGGKKGRKNSAGDRQPQALFADTVDFRGGKGRRKGKAASGLLDALRESNASLCRRIRDARKANLPRGFRQG